MLGDLPSQTPGATHSFHASLLSTYCVPDTVRCPLGVAVSEPDGTPAPHAILKLTVELCLAERARTRCGRQTDRASASHL